MTTGAGRTDTFGSLTLGAALTLAKTANVNSGVSSLVITGTTTFTTSANFTTPAGTLITLNDVNGGNAGMQLNLTGDMTVLGNISNVTQLAKNNTGTLTLSGTGSTYTGPTNINAGTVVVSKLADLGVASSLGAPITAGNGTILISFGTEATLKYVGDTDSSTNRILELAGNNNVGSTVDSSGAGTVAFTNAVKVISTTGNRTLTLTGTNAGNNTIGGAISNPTESGAVAVTKSGSGTWVLGGVNTYTGATLVSAGKLVVNGSLANTAVTVQNGAILAGSGTIAGLTTIRSGGHLAPGNSPGTLTFTDGVTLANGSILDLQLGTTSDLILITGGIFTGAADAGGVILNFSDAGGFDAGVYTLIDYTGATASGVDLEDFAINDMVAGYDYQLSQNGSQLQVTVTVAVPEPSTYGLLGAGTLALVASLARRRRRTRFGV